MLKTATIKDCSRNEMLFAINKAQLQDLELTADAVSLGGDPTCRAHDNGTHLVMRSLLTGCGSHETPVGNEAIFTISVRNDSGVYLFALTALVQTFLTAVAFLVCVSFTNFAAIFTDCVETRIRGQWLWL